MIRVVSARRMAELEREAIKRGASAEFFMKRAGAGIAEVIRELKISKNIFLLLGKGNNGGDLLSFSNILLGEGFSIRGYLFFKEEGLSPLFSKELSLFKRRGGEIVDSLDVRDDDIVVDGIFGIGFKGALPDHIVEALEYINSLKNYRIAVDISSGIDTETGRVGSVAFLADMTIFLGAGKLAAFIGDGYRYTGEVRVVDFGLDQKLLKEVVFPFLLLDEGCLKYAFKMGRTKNKYDSSVAAISGSLGMEGAANLSGYGALRAGAGIVKLFIRDLRDVKRDVFRDDLVKMELDFKKASYIIECLNREKAIYIGPGIGRGSDMERLFLEVIGKIGRPVVLDADALFFISKHPEIKLPKDAILTPHRREMLRLLGEEEMDDLKLLERTAFFSKRHNVSVVLKGAPTFIFCKGERAWISTYGSPALAKAGTGDVLTGIIAAFLANGLGAEEAATLGVFVHGKAGEILKEEKTEYASSALDLIEVLPKVFKKFF